MSIESNWSNLSEALKLEVETALSESRRSVVVPDNLTEEAIRNLSGNGSSVFASASASQWGTKELDFGLFWVSDELLKHLNQASSNDHVPALPGKLYIVHEAGTSSARAYGNPRLAARRILGEELFGPTPRVSIFKPETGDLVDATGPVEDVLAARPQQPSTPRVELDHGERFGVGHAKVLIEGITADNEWADAVVDDIAEAIMSCDFA